MKDFYKILGVSPSSTLPEIKKSYRGLSKKYHPDLNPGNVAFEEKFKALQEAYSVLKDPYKRRIFDEKLEARKRASTTINTPLVNNYRPHVHPPFSNKTRAAKRFTGRKGKPKKLQKKDIYFAAGIFLFLGIIVSTIFILESRYYSNEGNYESLDSSYEQPFIDSLNLIRGYEPDTGKGENKQPHSVNDDTSPQN